MYAAVGCGDISIGRVVHALVTQAGVEPTGFPVSYPEEISRETSGDIAVVGLKGVKNQLAGCCNPTPGDEILGFITRGRGATIHRRDCANILNVRDKMRKKGATDRRILLIYLIRHSIVSLFLYKLQSTNFLKIFINTQKNKMSFN